MIATVATTTIATARPPSSARSRSRRAGHSAVSVSASVYIIDRSNSIRARDGECDHHAEASVQTLNNAIPATAVVASEPIPTSGRAARVNWASRHTSRTIATTAGGITKNPPALKLR